MSRSKLLLFSIITAGTGVLGFSVGVIMHPFPHVSLPLLAESRGYMHCSTGTESAFHSPSAILFSFDWCCQHVIWSLPAEQGLGESVCIALVRYATPCSGTLCPSLTEPTFWSLDCHLDKAQLQPSLSTQHSQRRKHSLFQFSFQLKVSEFWGYWSVFANRAFL